MNFKLCTELVESYVQATTAVKLISYYPRTTTDEPALKRFHLNKLILFGIDYSGALWLRGIRLIRLYWTVLIGRGFAHGFCSKEEELLRLH